MRQVWQLQQRRAALMLDRIELRTERLDLLRALAVGFADRRGVLSLPRRARDLVAGRVLLALQPFDLGNDPAPRSLERGEIFERFVGIDAAIAQTFTNVIRVFAHENRVEHAPAIVRYDAAWPLFGKLSGKPSSPPPVSARGFFPQPKRSPRKCCRSWTSRSFSTASKKPLPLASTTSSSSPDAARTRSKITSTCRLNSKRSSKRAASA